MSKKKSKGLKKSDLSKSNPLESHRDKSASDGKTEPKRAVAKDGWEAKTRVAKPADSSQKQKRKHEVKDLKIHLDIFANALDFISTSLDPILSSKSEVDVKYSILHLHAGVELIFKEILKNEHWSLIFQKVDEADKQHLRTGNFVSVNHATALTRLGSICGIEFEEAELFSLEDLRRRRNIIEHYVFPVEENASALKSTVSEVLLTILNLIEEHFDEDGIKGHAAQNLETIRQKSMEFKEFVEKKLEKIQAELKKLSEEYEILTCPTCFQPAFVLNDNLQCLFCKYTDDPEDIAKAYIENVMKVSEYYEVTQGGHFPLDDCPDCQAHTLVARDQDYICFTCHQKSSNDAFDICNRCGGLYHGGEDEMSICGSCFGSLISGPD